jgi:hypothetical protein
MVRCGVAYAHLLAQTTGTQTEGHERGKERERNSGAKLQGHRDGNRQRDRQTDACIRFRFFVWLKSEAVATDRSLLTGGELSASFALR